MFQFREKCYTKEQKVGKIGVSALRGEGTSLIFFSVHPSAGRVYRKPFLLALQPPLVNLGETVTLECRSEIMFDTFILTSHKNGTIKDSFELSAEHYHGGSQANFSIGPVTPDDAGTYTCYGSLNHSPYEWSESSGPIDINITGLYKIPTLSALMGPGVMSGENMTLTCFSDLQFDMFHLSREGVPEGHELPSVQNNNGTFQANFLLGPVVQAGNYRCYGSFRNSSHLWSTPTDPLYILVTVNLLVTTFLTLTLL
uniref:Ig-like domain-containing protein n=1 Tax=Peromyscus maniculatus bairdii TaxID=230844 RepID=A0A8C8UKE1_PERMB